MSLAVELAEKSVTTFQILLFITKKSTTFAFQNHAVT